MIVVGLIGERSREVSRLPRHQVAGPVRQKSVVVAVPADHAPLLRLRAAMRATAIAEDFRARGLKVLLLIDSLTRVAHAQREIGLSLGEPPTVKGYPPSALGLIPRLFERAGADARDRRLDHRALHRARRRRRHRRSDRRRRPRDRRRPYHPVARPRRAGRLSGDRRRQVAEPRDEPTSPRPSMLAAAQRLRRLWSAYRGQSRPHPDGRLRAPAAIR